MKKILSVVLVFTFLFSVSITAVPARSERTAEELDEISLNNDFIWLRIRVDNLEDYEFIGVEEYLERVNTIANSHKEVDEMYLEFIELQREYLTERAFNELYNDVITTIENRRLELGDEYDKPYGADLRARSFAENEIISHNHVHLDDLPGLEDTIERMNNARSLEEVDEIYMDWILSLREYLPEEEYEEIYNVTMEEREENLRRNTELFNADMSVFRAARSDTEIAMERINSVQDPEERGRLLLEWAYTQEQFFSSTEEYEEFIEATMEAIEILKRDINDNIEITERGVDSNNIFPFSTCFSHFKRNYRSISSYYHQSECLYCKTVFVEPHNMPYNWSYYYTYAHAKLCSQWNNGCSYGIFENHNFYYFPHNLDYHRAECYGCRNSGLLLHSYTGWIRWDNRQHYRRCSCGQYNYAFHSPSTGYCYQCYTSN